MPIPIKKRTRRKHIFNTAWGCVLLFALLFFLVGTDYPLSTRINGSLFITLLVFIPALYLSIKGVGDTEAKEALNPTGPTANSVVNLFLNKEAWLTLIATALIVAAAILIEMKLGI